MKALRLIFLSMFLLQCKAPKVLYIDGVAISKDAKKTVLDKIQAHDNKYSLIFLAGGFDSKQIKIYNKDELFYDNKPESDKILGLADVVRILNDKNILFFDEDLNYKFILHKNKIKKYKYIYVTKDKYDEKYTIVYSNVLSGFK